MAQLKHRVFFNRLSAAQPGGPEKKRAAGPAAGVGHHLRPSPPVGPLPIRPLPVRPVFWCLVSTHCKLLPTVRCGPRKPGPAADITPPTAIHERLRALDLAGLALAEGCPTARGAEGHVRFPPHRHTAHRWRGC
eukprot:scaffold7904_cov103-Isochrysis_galbana.AAC.11